MILSYLIYRIRYFFNSVFCFRYIFTYLIFTFIYLFLASVFHHDHPGRLHSSTFRINSQSLFRLYSFASLAHFTLKSLIVIQPFISPSVNNPNLSSLLFFAFQQASSFLFFFLFAYLYVFLPVYCL